MKLRNWLCLLICLIQIGSSLQTPSFAKQVGEALTDLSQVQDTDPNGFRLMIMCIGLLFTLAATLIGVTVWYMTTERAKQRARARNFEQSVVLQEEEQTSAQAKSRGSD